MTCPVILSTTGSWLPSKYTFDSSPFTTQSERNMKYLRTPALVLATFFLFAVAGGSITKAQDQDKVENPDATVYVDGLACPFCAYGLEKKLKNLDALKTMEVQLEESRVLLAFKKGKSLTKDEIQKAVKKAGFTARKIEFPDEESFTSWSS